MTSYIPEQGDFIVISFDPQAGHEQKGRRPGVVVSVDQFNRGTRLAFCCPITNTDRGTNFHVAVPVDSGLTGFVMCEQMKSIDYRARSIKRIGEASPEFLDEVLSVIDACLFTKTEQDVDPNA
ncbi:MAG: type II toxin-antitoxin system PemK/MazF family toxin [Verrucomicrobiales bacterium]|nr:type II toxin-antitoxin system PemK/MazF family toxin [Verrucomicrobiales bacterium]